MQIFFYVYIILILIIYIQNIYISKFFWQNIYNVLLLLKKVYIIKSNTIILDEYDTNTTYGKFDADENVEKLCETRQMARLLWW